METTIIVSVRRFHRRGPASPPSKAIVQRPAGSGAAAGAAVVVAAVVGVAVVGAADVRALAAVLRGVVVGALVGVVVAAVVVMPSSANGLGMATTSSPEPVNTRSSTWS